jgi:hypothetical protein
MRPRGHRASLSLGQLPYVCVPDVCVPVSPAYVFNAKLRTNTKSCPPSASCPSTHGTRIRGAFVHELDDGRLIGKRRGLRSSENVQAATMPLPIEAVLLQAIIGEQTRLCRSAIAEGVPPPFRSASVVMRESQRMTNWVAKLTSTSHIATTRQESFRPRRYYIPSAAPTCTALLARTDDAAQSLPQNFPEQTTHHPNGHLSGLSAPLTNPPTALTSHVYARSDDGKDFITCAQICDI